MMGATCGAAYPSGAHEFTVVGFCITQSCLCNVL